MLELNHRGLRSLKEFGFFLMKVKRVKGRIRSKTGIGPGKGVSQRNQDQVFDFLLNQYEPQFFAVF